MKTMFGLFLAAFLVGCAGAQLIERTLSPAGGTVQYKNGNVVREESRKIALAKITEYCKGPYQIVSEKFNPDVLSINVGGTFYTPDKANFMYLKFTCN